MSTPDPAPTKIDQDVFLRRYLIHAASQVPGRDARDLRECANAHLALGHRRQPGELVDRQLGPHCDFR